VPEHADLVRQFLWSRSCQVSACRNRRGGFVWQVEFRYRPSRAAITGTVKDASEAVVPGAKITFTDLKNQTRTDESNER